MKMFNRLGRTIVFLVLVALLLPASVANGAEAVTVTDPNLEALIRQDINNPPGDIYQGVFNEPGGSGMEIKAAATDPTVIATIQTGGGGYYPIAVAVNPITNRIYVANQGSDNVSVIDGNSNTVIATVNVGGYTSSVAVDMSTNRIYVGNIDSNTVSVIDGVTNVVVATVSVDGAPYSIAVNPSTNRIYVVSSGSNIVSVIDGTTNAVLSTVNVISMTQDVTVNSQTNLIYVTPGGAVLVIDGETNAVVGGTGVSGMTCGVAVNPITNLIYVTSSYGVVVIDGASNTIVATVGVSGGPVDVAVNSSNNRIYVANSSSNNVSVIDGASNTVIATVPVGSEPRGVAVNPDTNRIYVANSGSDTVSVIQDGGAEATPRFVLQVPSFYQGDSRWGSDTMGTDDCTLSGYGCAVTCTAMVLNYYGVSAFDTTYNDYFLNDTNPKDLNQWLKQHSGYSGNGIVWASVEAYSNADEKGIDFVESQMNDWPEGTNIAGVSLVRDEIVAGHPVIVQVKTLWNGSLTGHWVVVKGLDSGTYYINDPAWLSSRTTLSSYDNTIYAVRVYHGTVPPQYTLVGSNVGVTLPGAVLRFNTVTGSGNTAVTTSTENQAGGIPSGMGVGSPFLDITTTAIYTGPITVGLYYDASQIINEGILKLFHWTGNLWEDVTTLVDTVNDVVYGQVSSLSWFAIMQPITSVSGVTMEVNGDILTGVTITLDGNSTAISDPNGQFQILVTTTGSHTLVAHKNGFRDRTQPIIIEGLGEAYDVTCNFQGVSGLIPKAPDIWYALDCVNLWLYPPNPDTGLDIWTALDAVNAWLYPVQ